MFVGCGNCGPAGADQRVFFRSAAATPVLSAVPVDDQGAMTRGVTGVVGRLPSNAITGGKVPVVPGVTNRLTKARLSGNTYAACQGIYQKSDDVIQGRNVWDRVWPNDNRIIYFCRGRWRVSTSTWRDVLIQGNGGRCGRFIDSDTGHPDWWRAGWRGAGAVASLLPHSPPSSRPTTYPTSYPTGFPTTFPTAASDAGECHDWCTDSSNGQGPQPGTIAESVCEAWECRGCAGCAYFWNSSRTECEDDASYKSGTGEPLCPIWRMRIADVQLSDTYEQHCSPGADPHTRCPVLCNTCPPAPSTPAPTVAASFLGFDGLKATTPNGNNVVQVFAVWDQAETNILNVFDATVFHTSLETPKAFLHNDFADAQGGSWKPSFSFESFPGVDSPEHTRNPREDSFVSLYCGAGAGWDGSELSTGCVGASATDDVTALDPNFQGGLGADIPELAGWYNSNPSNVLYAQEWPGGLAGLAGYARFVGQFVFPSTETSFSFTAKLAYIMGPPPMDALFGDGQFEWPIVAPTTAAPTTAAPTSSPTATVATVTHARLDGITYAACQGIYTRSNDTIQGRHVWDRVWPDTKRSIFFCAGLWRVTAAQYREVVLAEDGGLCGRFIDSDTGAPEWYLAGWAGAGATASAMDWSDITPAPTPAPTPVVDPTAPAELRARLRGHTYAACQGIYAPSNDVIQGRQVWDRIWPDNKRFIFYCWGKWRVTGSQYRATIVADDGGSCGRFIDSDTGGATEWYDAGWSRARAAASLVTSTDCALQSPAANGVPTEEFCLAGSVLAQVPAPSGEACQSVCV